jgi:hypothetical protein
VIDEQDDVFDRNASVHYINEAGVPESVVNELRGNKDIASAMERWSQSLSLEDSRQSVGMFHRGKWEGSNHAFSEMSQAAWAVENDDILSTLADVTEGLMFQRCRFELFDLDQQDVWNQWAAEVDLDTTLRTMARELFKVSQVYVGIDWEDRSYQLRDSPIDGVIDDALTGSDSGPATAEPLPKKPGNRKRRKRFNIAVPASFTVFDPTKIMPVGQLLFGKEKYAYIASDLEHISFSGVMSGVIADPTVRKMLDGPYTPSEADKFACAEVGVDSSRLWLFREGAIFRHTLTRADYERFAQVRLKSIFPLLEMKYHLRNSDRSTLIGSSNFIIVITKGTDKLPAKQAEIDNLKEQTRVVARLPVLVGDHRLHVEIVSPQMDNTLIESRWQVLDSRLVFKALQSFSPVVQGGNSGGVGVSEMSRVVAKGLESRRHMLMRSLEKYIFKVVMELNQGALTESPSITFNPKRITLDFKADVFTQILKLRDRGDVSRETTLEEVEFDQDVEVLRRARERKVYDRIFESSTPYASPAANPYGPNNRQVQPEGGRPKGASESDQRNPKGDGPKSSV